MKQLTVREIIQMHNSIEEDYTREQQIRLVESIARLMLNGNEVLVNMGLSDGDQKSLATVMLEALVPSSENEELAKFADKNPIIVGSLLYSAVALVAGIMTEMADERIQEMVKQSKGLLQ
jgi:hypothetical protein